jgi:hypothetical protein
MISDTPNHMVLDDDFAPWNDPIEDEDVELDDLEEDEKFDEDEDID